MKPIFCFTFLIIHSLIFAQQTMDYHYFEITDKDTTLNINRITIVNDTVYTIDTAYTLKFTEDVIFYNSKQYYYTRKNKIKIIDDDTTYHILNSNIKKKYKAGNQYVFSVMVLFDKESNVTDMFVSGDPSSNSREVFLDYELFQILKANQNKLWKGKKKHKFYPVLFIGSRISWSSFQ